VYSVVKTLFQIILNCPMRIRLGQNHEWVKSFSKHWKPILCRQAESPPHVPRSGKSLAAKRLKKRKTSNHWKSAVLDRFLRLLRLFAAFFCRRMFHPLEIIFPMFGKLSRRWCGGPGS
jgi:hypothetical protein